MTPVIALPTTNDRYVLTGRHERGSTLHAWAEELWIAIHRLAHPEDYSETTLEASKKVVRCMSRVERYPNLRRIARGQLRRKRDVSPH